MRTFTEEQIRKISRNAMLTDNWDVHVYKYPDGSKHGLNEQEFHEWFNNQIKEL